MNKIIIKDWPGIIDTWYKWKDFKENDPIPKKFDISEVFISSSCFLNRQSIKNLCFYNNETLIGMARVIPRTTPEGITIGGIGNVAVDPLYRNNGVCNKLMEVCILYMKHVGFDISILWATVLRIYERYGYIAIRDTNMMIRTISAYPGNLTVDRILALSKEMGTW